VTSYFDEAFAGGSNGANITTSNTTFDLITGTVPTFVNDSPLAGALSMKVNISTAAQSSGRGQLGASRAVVYINYPLKANTAWASGNWFPHEARASTTIRADCRIPSGVPTIRNGTTAVWTSGVTLPTGVWLWCEHKIDNTNSKQSFTVWDASGNVVVASGDQTYNSGTMDNIVVGNTTSVANVGVSIGRVRVSSTPLGPLLQTVALGQVVESDTATAMGHQKVVRPGQTLETDTAQPFTHSKTTHPGQTTETDTAQPITARKVATTGQAVESDTARPMAASKVFHLGQAQETDAAGLTAPAKRVALGQVVESDTAGQFRASIVRVIGQAVEADAASASGIAKLFHLGMAAEASAALALTAARRITIGQATEDDEVQPLTGVHIIRAGPADVFRSPDATASRTPDPTSISRAAGATVRRTA
jgi:hypothetical protein